jgi:hypothetical protein
VAELGSNLAEDDLTDEFELDEDGDSAFGDGVDLSELSLAEKLALLRPRLKVEQIFIVNSDFGSQEVDTYISSIRASVALPLARKFGIRLVTAADISVYDFDGDNDFIYTGRKTGEPFDELVSNLFRLEGIYLLNERWRLLGGAFMTSRFETGVAYSSGIEGGGFAGVHYQWSEDLSVVLGLGIGSSMSKSSVALSPVFQLAWRITDDVEIKTEGIGFRIGTRLSDAFEATLGVGFEGNRYRLGDRDGFIEPGDPASGEVNKGSLRDRRLHVAASLVWRPSDKWRIRTSLGMVPYQQYTTKDHDGDTLDKNTINSPAFASELAVEYRF